jgi:hypothetical protein
MELDLMQTIEKYLNDAGYHASLWVAWDRAWVELHLYPDGLVDENELGNWPLEDQVAWIVDNARRLVSNMPISMARKVKSELIMGPRDCGDGETYTEYRLIFSSPR